ncbi:MAG TPA: hypothetical protein VFZ84_07475 [Burkholderiales bacterium]
MKDRLAWVVAAAAALANVLAYLLSLYELTWFDEALHAFTLFALALLAAHLLSDDLGSATPAARFVLIFSFGMAAGAVWEIVEWGYDSFTPASNLIKGKEETMSDLLWDAAGAALAAGLSARRKRRQRTAVNA